MFAAIALALTATSVTTSFAQDAAAAQEAKTALYTKFTECYAKRRTLPPADLDACYAVGKDYLDKYEKDNDQYSQFVRKVYDAYIKLKAAEDLANRFNGAISNPKAINADQAYTSGKEFIDQNPDSVDVPIVLASIGFDNVIATPPNDKYNADAINYAKMAIERINSGKTSPSGQYGAYQYTYKTTKYPDGKNNTLGWMNYYIGYIMYNRQNQKKEALPYLYKAAQINSGAKDSSELYRLIGSWYVDEFKRIDDDRVAKVKAAGNQDTNDTKALFALEKGYAERAADAYARAAKIADTNPTATKEYKDALLTRAKQFYGIRYNNDPAKTDGFDAYMAAITNKPLIDPTTAVTPVVEETPATTTATGTTPATPATTPTTTTAKPTTTRTTTTTTTTKPATPAKTPTTPPKKKGNR
ncbi:MAG: hypothetical protein ACR2GD_02320 [Pyrinomonadaceae bacterium]